MQCLSLLCRPLQAVESILKSRQAWNSWKSVEDNTSGSRQRFFKSVPDEGTLWMSYLTRPKRRDYSRLGLGNRPFPGSAEGEPRRFENPTHLKRRISRIRQSNVANLYSEKNQLCRLRKSASPAGRYRCPVGRRRAVNLLENHPLSSDQPQFRLSESFKRALIGF
jgi:hypothetical protein